MKTKVYLLEEDRDFVQSFLELLALDGHEGEATRTLDPVFEFLRQGGRPVVVADAVYRNLDGVNLMQKMRSVDASVPVVFLAVPEVLSTAKEMGGFDVLLKPIQTNKLFDVIGRAAQATVGAAQQTAPAPMANSPEPSRPTQPQTPIPSQDALNLSSADETAQKAPKAPAPAARAFSRSVLGRTDAVIALRKQLVQLSAQEDDVLIVGESGLFKKDIAQEIFAQSARKDGPFIAVKSDSFAPKSFEEELLGTDDEVLTAQSGKRSLLDQALNGVLYIEDIEKLTTRAQATLINIINSRSDLRKAGLQTGALNFRLIASVSNDLASLAPQINDALAAHFSTFVAKIPPIRERSVDAVVSFDHFLNEDLIRDNLAAPEHSARLMRFLLSHPWPENVAEIRRSAAQYANELRRAAGVPERAVAEAALTDRQDALRQSPSPRVAE